MAIDYDDFIIQELIQDMEEGVMYIAPDGRIRFINPAALEILERSEEDLYGKTFAKAFFGNKGSDMFNQTILDAIYDPDKNHDNVVYYFVGKRLKQLHVMSSYMRHEGKKNGVIIVFSDITNLAEMRLEHIKQITFLLNSIVKSFSTAIDARSPYNANHTKNMAKMGQAFLQWLDETDNTRKMTDSRKREFLMSIWLHDVGKLVIPLEIMDKSNRLGDKMRAIEDRFVKIKLLQRIEMLEGKITEEDYNKRIGLLDETLEVIHRLNEEGIRNESDEKYYAFIEHQKYVDENGKKCSLMTEDELECLAIKRGTLTDKERNIIRNHVVFTKRILDEVRFPDEYKMVPVWASMHHELLNGNGYPEGVSGSDIPWEVRLLTVLDVFESLTATDRPYKVPMPAFKAFAILDKMVEEGEIDEKILSLFKESGAWKVITV